MNGGEKMERDEFAEQFVTNTFNVTLLYVVTEPYKTQDRPVVLLAMFEQEPGAFRVVAKWMPWASNRDIITASLTFVMEVRRKFTLLFYFPSNNATLANHLGRYGVIRKVGTIHEFFEDGGAQLWQAKPS